MPLLRILIWYLLLAPVILFAGSSDAPLKLAWIGRDAGNPADASVWAGLSEAAASLRGAQAVQVENLTLHAMTAMQQRDAIKAAVNHGCDAIVINCVEADRLTPAIDAATLAGLAVVTVYHDAPASNRLATLLVDDAALGEALINTLPRQSENDSGAVVLLTALDTAPLLLQTCLRELDARADWHRVAILEPDEGENASAALARYSSDPRHCPDVILCLSRDASLTLKKPEYFPPCQPRLHGLGWSPLASRALQTGIFQTLVDGDGYAAGKLALTAIIDLRTPGHSPVPKVQFIPLRVMRPSDATGLLANWQNWTE